MTARGCIPVRELIREAKAQGVEAFASALGPLLLVGQLEPDAGVADGWGQFTAPGSSVAINPLGKLLDATAICLLGDPFLTIGRLEDNDVRLLDSSISSHHARIAIDTEGRVWLRDEGSSNGTTVSGKPLGTKERIELTEGTLVRMGDVDFRVHDTRRLHRILCGFNL